MNARERLRQAIGRTVAALEAMGYALPPDIAPDAFALRGTGTPGRKPAAILAVNAYQNKLQRIYRDWADTLADDLADADPSEHDDIIKAALAALLLLLRNAGRTALPDAVTLGLGDDTINPDVLKVLTDALTANEDYLSDSLLPDLDSKLRQGLSEQDILEAIAAGAGAAAIGGLLQTMLGRVGSYAGGFWDVYNRTRGDAIDEHGKRLRWSRDDSIPDSSHCENCWEFGNQEYNSYSEMLEITGGLTPGSPALICGSNCRCELEEID